MRAPAGIGFGMTRCWPALFPLLFVATPAFAYIDPNVGGQVAQLLTPIVTMLLAALAFARHWLKAMLGRIAAVFRGFLTRGKD